MSVEAVRPEIGRGAGSFFCEKLKEIGSVILVILAIGSGIGIIPLAYYYFADKKVEQTANPLPPQINPVQASNPPIADLLPQAVSPATTESFVPSSQDASPKESFVPPVKKTQEERDREMNKGLFQELDNYINKAMNMIIANGKIKESTREKMVTELHSNVISILLKNGITGSMKGRNHEVFQRVFNSRLYSHLDQISDVNIQNPEVKKILLAFDYEPYEFSGVVGNYQKGRR